MKLRYVLPVAFLFVSVLVSCLNDKQDEAVPSNSCDTTYYFNTIKPLLQTHCIGNNTACHVAGGAGSGDFNSFMVVKDKIESGIFSHRVFVLMDMPPNPSILPPLSAADRTLLQEWIDDGYPGCD